MRSKLMFSLLIFLVSVVYSQEKKREPFKIGWNAMQVIGKSVDFYAEKEVLPRTAIYVDYGYTFAPTTPPNLSFKGHYFKHTKLTGEYFKMGLKGSFHRYKAVDLWAGILAVYSKYDEVI